jgi:hypothetical protein
MLIYTVINSTTQAIAIVNNSYYTYYLVNKLSI